MILERVRRGQAAMEFLMTYGWAILAAIIAIGVLFLIIGNPQSWVGDQYSMTSPFSGTAASVSAANGVSIGFNNGVGDAITVSNITVEGCGSDATGWSVANNALLEVTVACTPALTAGDRLKGDITVLYTKTGSSIVGQGSGNINMKVVA